MCKNYTFVRQNFQSMEYLVTCRILVLTGWARQMQNHCREYTAFHSLTTSNWKSGYISKRMQQNETTENSAEWVSAKTSAWAARSLPNILILIRIYINIVLDYEPSLERYTMDQSITYIFYPDTPCLNAKYDI